MELDAFVSTMSDAENPDAESEALRITVESAAQAFGCACHHGVRPRAATLLPYSNQHRWAE